MNKIEIYEAINELCKNLPNDMDYGQTVRYIMNLNSDGKLTSEKLQEILVSRKSNHFSRL
jgi:hypothetical protein